METIQRQQQTLNAVGMMMFELPSDAGLAAARDVLRSLKQRNLPVMRSLWDMGKGLDHVFKAAYRYRLQRRGSSSERGPTFLKAHAEQEPDPDSRIALGPEVDALGMARAVVEWRVTDLNERTFRVLAEAFGTEFERLQLGAAEPTASLKAAGSLWERQIHDVNHHMGTTRMHDDPRLGTVDRNCQMHGVDNLYIGSSAVFPTGGYSNPTLTIIALCLRSSDRLKTML